MQFLKIQSLQNDVVIPYFIIYFKRKASFPGLLLKVVFCFLIFASSQAFSQENVGIGTSNPDSSAVLELSIEELSTPKGILLPRLTTAQRDAVILPAYTLLIYNITNLRFEYNAGTAAIPLWTGLSGGGAAGAWTLAGNADTDPAQNFIGTTDAKDLVFKTDDSERLRITSEGNLLLKSEATASELRFFAPYGSGLYYSAFKAGLQGANITYTLPLAQGDSATLLGNDGNGVLSWTVAGSGSVTSVGLDLPDIFDVINSPISSNGTLTAVLTEQNEHTFFAGPLTVPGIPTFRTIDTSDLPVMSMDKLTGTLPVSKGGTGVSSITGILTGNGTDPVTGRTIMGTADQISITDGNGAVANPTIAIALNPVLPGTASTTVSAGTTADRPASPSGGMIRFNTTTGKMESYQNSDWKSVIRGAGTPNYLSKFDSDSTSITNSIVFDNGTSVGIKNASPSASAALDINSTTQGFLPPRMSHSQKNSISAPAEGLTVYVTDSTSEANPKGIYYWDGTSWRRYVRFVSPTSEASMRVISKATQQQITGTSTPVNDSALILPISAGERWIVDALVLIQVTGSSTQEVNFRFSLPTGATLDGGYHINAGSNVASFAANGISNTTQYSFPIINNTVTHVLLVKFVVTATTNSGNIIFACAPSNTSNTVNVKPGSYFIAARGTQ